MASDFEIDGLTELVRDLSEAPGKVQRKVDAVVRKGAVNVTRDWRQNASGLAHAPAYPASITHEAKWERGAFVAEIGPDKGLPQGALGNLITYGSANSPPHPHDIAALAAEAPRFEKAMENLGDL